MLRIVKLLGVGAAVVVMIALVGVMAAQITPSHQPQNQCLKELFLAMSMGVSQDLLKSRYSFHESHETVPKATYRALKAGALLAGADKPAKFWDRADSFKIDITKLPACE